MSMSLKPLGNRVVVEPIEMEEMTSGGIVLPETAKEKPQKGKILSINASAETIFGYSAAETLGTSIETTSAAANAIRLTTSSRIPV